MARIEVARTAEPLGRKHLDGARNVERSEDCGCITKGAGLRQLREALSGEVSQCKTDPTPG